MRNNRIFIPMVVSLAIFANLGFYFGQDIFNNKSHAVEEKKTNELSKKRGELNITGGKNKKYRIILKKIYTSDKIGSKGFYNSIYNVPEFAQAIEIQGKKAIPFNRENIIETDEYGEANFKNILLGEYEIKALDEAENIAIYNIRIPSSNKKEDKYFKIDLKDEKINGGAFEIRVLDGNKPVENMNYGLYKIVKTAEEIAEEGIESIDSEKIDSDGNMVEKIYRDLKTDKDGYIRANELDLGKYYIKLEETNPKYIWDERKIDLEIDSIGAVRLNGGLKAGEVITKEIQAYSIPKIDAKINNKDLNIDTNFLTPFVYNYTVEIPNNLDEYSNMYFSTYFDQNIILTNTEIKIDGEIVELPIEEGIGIIRIDLNDKDKLRGKKKVEINYKAEVSDKIDNKDMLGNSSFIEFSVLGLNEKSESNILGVNPTYGSLKIINKDKKYEHAIQGSIFELKDGDKTIKKGKTDTRGYLVWEKVPYGKYELIQSNPSKEYRNEYKRIKPIQIEINNQNIDKKLIVENSILKKGFFTRDNIIIAVSLLILISLIVFIIKKRKINSNQKPDDNDKDYKV
ncbi:MAG: SpaA isopeptide-forming pilin-related protein [Andreesenia angusta]|nr:SpaA isopeptide-forming pilin-related protein [Andreesenia angusta]